MELEFARQFVAYQPSMTTKQAPAPLNHQPFRQSRQTHPPRSQTEKRLWQTKAFANAADTQIRLSKGILAREHSDCTRYQLATCTALPYGVLANSPLPETRLNSMAKV